MSIANLIFWIVVYLIAFEVMEYIGKRLDFTKRGFMLFGWVMASLAMLIKWNPF